VRPIFRARPRIRLAVALVRHGVLARRTPTGASGSAGASRHGVQAAGRGAARCRAPVLARLVRQGRERRSSTCERPTRPGIGQPAACAAPHAARRRPSPKRPSAFARQHAVANECNREADTRSGAEDRSHAGARRESRVLRAPPRRAPARRDRPLDTACYTDHEAILASHMPETGESPMAKAPKTLASEDAAPQDVVREALGSPTSSTPPPMSPTSCTSTCTSCTK